MILTIDIGNTNIVIGCYQEDNLLFHERFSTNPYATSLEYATIFKETFAIHHIEASAIEGGILSSVVPSVTDTVKKAVEKYTGAKFLVVGPGLKTGLKLAIENPAQLGADLVVGAVAGAEYYPVPQIIIDMGTATTVSVIDKNKAFIGKMILPGIGISMDALTSRTAQLPKVSLELPKKLIAGNTIDSMKSGILYGSAGALDGLIDRINEELGESCTVVGTGGLMSTIAPLCRNQMIVEDDLLLKGLLLIYRKNRP